MEGIENVKYINVCINDIYKLYINNMPIYSFQKKIV